MKNPDTVKVVQSGDREDPRLGRLIHIDKRSFSFPVSEILTEVPKKPRSYTWRCEDHLNQGVEGSCVGFAWIHELIARPSEVTGLTATHARKAYKLAQTMDPWPTEDYEGTSVLAGIKAVMQLHKGKITEYRWAHTLNEVILTLGYKGPVVFGINWKAGMQTPDSSGLIKATGHIVGGHAILGIGVDVKKKLIQLHNSWGPGWGKNGNCFISFDDMDRLLGEAGECCVAVKREPEPRRKVQKAA